VVISEHPSSESEDGRAESAIQLANGCFVSSGEAFYQTPVIHTLNVRFTRPQVSHRPRSDGCSRSRP
jgi:hypothetical protein